jgi:hypothetical protein
MPYRSLTMADLTVPGRVLIERQQLLKKIPLCARTIYDMEKRGEFPRRFTIGHSGGMGSGRSGCVDRGEKRVTNRSPPPHEGRSVKPRVSLAYKSLVHSSIISAHACNMARRCSAYSALL